MERTRSDVTTSATRTYSDVAVRLSSEPPASVPHHVGEIAPSPREPVDPVTSGQLVVTRGPDMDKHLRITEARTSIGRGHDCDIVLDDSTVSVWHAELLRDGAHYVLTDQDSLTGVYVNRKMVGQARLEDGDEIWIGKVRFVFRAAS